MRVHDFLLVKTFRDVFLRMHFSTVTMVLLDFLQLKTKCGIFGLRYGVSATQVSTPVYEKDSRRPKDHGDLRWSYFQHSGAVRHDNLDCQGQEEGNL